MILHLFQRYALVPATLVGLAVYYFLPDEWGVWLKLPSALVATILVAKLLYRDGVSRF